MKKFIMLGMALLISPCAYAKPVEVFHCSLTDGAFIWALTINEDSALAKNSLTAVFSSEKFGPEDHWDADITPAELAKSARQGRIEITLNPNPINPRTENPGEALLVLTKDASGAFVGEFANDGGVEKATCINI